MFKGVVFDCDGVLINSQKANVQFYNRILQNLGLAVMSPDDEEFVHSHTVQESIAALVPDHLLDKAYEVKADISYSQVMDSISLEAGILDCLRFLKKSGLLCAVNTNRTDTMGLILDKFGLAEYFQLVVTSLDVRRPKPDPESLTLILNSWAMHPQDIVFVGDSQVDELTARAAGTSFWAYKNEDLVADLHLGGHADLIRAVKKTGSSRPV